MKKLIVLGLGTPIIMAILIICFTSGYRENIRTSQEVATKEAKKFATKKGYTLDNEKGEIYMNGDSESARVTREMCRREGYKFRPIPLMGVEYRIFRLKNKGSSVNTHLVVVNQGQYICGAYLE